MITQQNLNATERLALKLKTLEDIYANNPWRWFCDQVFTIDESQASGRVMPWPREKQYLEETLDVLTRESRVIIPKSRRMMISWLAAGFFVHTARYTDHAALFWQSEIEQKAAFIVDKRCMFIEEHLRFPEFRSHTEKYKTKTGMVGKLIYPNGSYIWALAQGGDTFRTYTATKIVMDECEFQQQAPEAMRALLPMIEHGAQVVLISSSNGPVGVMAGLCRETGFMKWTRGHLRRVA